MRMGGQLTQELTTSETACITPAQDQANQNRSSVGEAFPIPN